MRSAMIAILLAVSPTLLASTYFDLYYEGRKAAESGPDDKNFTKAAKVSCKEVNIYLSKHSDKISGLIQWDKEMFQKEVATKGFKLNETRDNLARVLLREKITAICKIK